MKGHSVFFWSAMEEPREFSNRVGLFTWQQLMTVQQTMYLAVPGCAGMRPGGLFGWWNDSSVVLLLSVWTGI